jgi:thiamine pyrophosphate-dependent acetolactate synthase large subunit-like protein
MRLFATPPAIAGKRTHFQARINFVKLARAMGRSGDCVATRKDFSRALRRPVASHRFYLFKAIIASEDISSTWWKISNEVKARIRA